MDNLNNDSVIIELEAVTEDHIVSIHLERVHSPPGKYHVMLLEKERVHKGAQHTYPISRIEITLRRFTLFPSIHPSTHSSPSNNNNIIENNTIIIRLAADCCLPPPPSDNKMFSPSSFNNASFNVTFMSDNQPLHSSCPAACQGSSALYRAQGQAVKQSAAAVRGWMEMTRAYPYL